MLMNTQKDFLQWQQRQPTAFHVTTAAMRHPHGVKYDGKFIS